MMNQQTKSSRQWSFSKGYTIWNPAALNDKLLKADSYAFGRLFNVTINNFPNLAIADLIYFEVKENLFKDVLNAD